MPEALEAAKGIGDLVVWLAGVTSALAVLAGLMYKWIAKPVKEMKTEMKAENKVIMERIGTVQESVEELKDDTGDIICDRLNQAHDYHVKKGWCPKADKGRLLDMHKRYTDMGRNHLVESYADDLLHLPEQPPPRTRRSASNAGT